MPSTYFIALLLLSLGLHFFFALKQLTIPSPYNYLGVMFIISGVMMNFWSDSLFNKNKTTVKPAEDPSVLMMSGPFRISRHPMYLGMVMILLGLAIFLGSAIAFLPLMIFMIIIETIFIPEEEKNLKRIFGEGYLNYKQKVRRWI